jgi:hypothetical protein
MDSKRHIAVQDIYTIRPTSKVKRSALELGDTPLKANCDLSLWRGERSSYILKPVIISNMEQK